MLTPDVIQSAVQKLVAAAQPSRVILFGSYARGEASEDSDLDLLVVESRVENRGAEMVRLRRAIGRLGTGVDVLVYSEEEVARRGGVPGTVIYWALQEGKTLYDART
ncbi:MAG: nucleotidyltransferase domain-containing protein [Sulfurimicrobium sp.]|nr:nucleotidyltransferase domain-containing protein [Sulfurimicrobium sp.]